jgi:hypothetical protein
LGFFIPAGSPFRLSLFLLAVAFWLWRGRRQRLRCAAMSDAQFMRLALRFARRGCGMTSPNLIMA